MYETRVFTSNKKRSISVVYFFFSNNGESKKMYIRVPHSSTGVLGYEEKSLQSWKVENIYHFVETLIFRMYTYMYIPTIIL